MSSLSRVVRIPVTVAAFAMIKSSSSSRARRPDLKSAIASLLLIATIQAGCATATGPGRAAQKAAPVDTLEARRALGDLNGAIEAYRQLLARRPDLPDARYNLALALKLAHRDAEATSEFLAAARLGHAAAQYFLGAAYAVGIGVDRDLALAIMWWSRAADQGIYQAQLSLGELRQTALGRSTRGSAERSAVEQAFRDYRARLWDEFPELARNGDDDTVGAALLRQSRVREAVPVLIREASSLSEPAQGLLEVLYYHGVQGRLLAHDGRILDYFQTAAQEGRPRARIALARFYAAGLGVPKDTARAISLLRATPHEDAQRLLQELSAATEAAPAPARP